MPTYTPNAVVAHSFSHPDFTLTMNLSGAPALTDVGKAASLDATGSNTAKLAADNDVILGRLETVETGGLDGLTVGAIARKFQARLPIKAGLTGFNAVAVGDTVCGAGAGEVKALNSGSAKTPNHALNIVVAIEGSFAVVSQL